MATVSIYTYGNVISWRLHTARRNEVSKICVVRDKNHVFAAELKEFAHGFFLFRCARDHFIRDTGELRNLCGNGLFRDRRMY